VEVSQGDFVSVGQELATVATTGRLRARFGVNAAEIKYFRKGDEVSISSDNVAATGHGEVTRVASSADPATRTFQVEVTIDNADGHFNPGMFVRIDYIRERLTDVIAVPRSAILTLDNKETVFTARGDRAEKRILSLGAEMGGKVVVQEGLAPGDTLIILGQDYLDDSMLINITDLEEREQ
jgi:membrane fusion protein (multidrug efflux system)